MNDETSISSKQPEQLLSEIEFLRKELALKNRELEIEASLEKIRARTIAMQKSEELAETSLLLFEEFKALGEIADQVTIGIFDENNSTAIMSATINGSQLLQVEVDLNEPIVMKKVYDSWLKNEKSVIIETSGASLRKYNQYRNTLRGYKLFSEDVGPEDRWIVHCARFSKGMLSFSSSQRKSPELLYLLERFASVFDLTYRRFLELKKAENHAREAEIELSLENVRSTAMSMNQAEDMLDVCRLIAIQLERLGVKEIRNVQTAIFYEAKGTYMNYEYYVKHDKKIVTETSYTNNPIHRQFAEQMLKGKGETYITHLPKSDLAEWLRYQRSTNVFIDEFLETAPSLNYYWYSLGPVALGLSTYVELKETDLDLFRRFVNVFELAFRRHMDIEKATMQAREARIEAALEKVRTKAMAMHSTKDLHDAVSIVFEQLALLKLDIIRCGIGIIKPGRIADVWVTTISDGGTSVQVHGDESFDIHPMLSQALDACERQDDFSYILEGADLISYYRAVERGNFHLPDSQIIRNVNPDLKQYYRVAPFEGGGLFAFSDHPFSEEAKKILRRFSDVFNLTYKRFQDIQKAEASAKEAKIEAALEKVRSRTNAMQHSDELAETAAVLFEQLQAIGETPERTFIGIVNEEEHVIEIWATQHGGSNMNMQVKATIDEPHVMNPSYKAWKAGKRSLAIDLQGTALEEYFQFIKAFGAPVSREIFGDRRIENVAFFSKGMVGVITTEPQPQEAIEVYERFAKAFDLTYTRFQDLQKAEANTRIAIRQSSMDRIRAEIASMRTKDDLQKITPLIWQELNVLQVPFVRCGIFIMDDKTQQIQSFLSTPDGKAIAAFRISYDSTAGIQRMVQNWKDKKAYNEYWNETQFEEFAQLLEKNGVLFPLSPYWESLPKKGIHLHYIPFMQGMLYVGNSEQLDEGQIKLLTDISASFSTAYSRYDDFSRLESAKDEVDKALDELKQTQVQLIQSEKMASLGELTAGIAHEIQNPLNFVNNFSEVSNELLEEMRSQIDNGDTSEAKQIAEDVKKNLEKILFHGKRADAIVKGMLQHSRSSSGQKEMTDINALADEYIRLAYHGLRAKNKSFNANFKCDFDNSIGKISVIPQDMGRVLLNLVNNAFYTVSEKKAQGNGTYEPMVSIQTKKYGSTIEIIVQDNGNGIPPKVLDKIFQPFFTTKPTGQGTGLGLSLSYDIITKGHGGQLKVETKEGAGTQFIILLPE